MTIRKNQAEEVVSKISGDRKSVHIHGIPGMGKSKFLDAVQRRLKPDHKILRVTVRFQDDPSVLYQDILAQTREEAAFLAKSKNRLIGLTGTIGTFGLGGTLDDEKRPIKKLEDLLSDWGTPNIVVIIENVDKVSEDDSVVRDVIAELDSTFDSENVPIITSGEIKDSPLEQFHLKTFTLSQTREFLESQFPNPSEEDIKHIHLTLEGHPLYLRMIADSADTLENVDLPEEEVYENTERLYLENLSTEELRFLRKSAPLPHLSADICGRVLPDFSKDQCDILLDNLANKVIIQNENRTHRGYKVYHIHRIFRQVLIERLTDENEIRRKAVLARSSIISDIIRSSETEENMFRRVSPHAMIASRHIENMYDSVTAEAVYEELTESELSVLQRGFVSILILTTGNPDEIGKVAELTHNDLTEKLSENDEINTTQRQIITEISGYLVGKLDGNSIENKSLTDISVSGEIEELPEGDELFKDSELDISEKQQEKLLVALQNALRFFFTDEPFSKKTHRRLLEVTVSKFGISPEILIECAQTCSNILDESEAGEEFAKLMSKRVEKMSERLHTKSAGMSDLYMMSDIGIELGNEVFQEFLNRQVIDDGIVIKMAIEGGEVLQRAENPIFAVVWYTIFIEIIRDRDAKPETMETLIEQRDEMLSQRQEFEENISDPIIESVEASIKSPEKEGQ